MSGHRAIIEAGPGVIRRICCSTSQFDSIQAAGVLGAALAAIDDQVALVAERPVAVGALWRAALRSLDCGEAARHGAVIVHPSWWSPARVGVVTAAAKSLPGDVVVRPRSWLLARASSADPEPVVVEIDERLVVIVGARTVGIPRSPDARVVAEKVAGAIDEISTGATQSVVIDAPSSVTGASNLARQIAGVVRDGGRSTVEVDANRLSRLASSAQPSLSARDGPSQQPRARSPRDIRSRAWIFSGAAVVVALTAAVPVAAAVSRHGVAPAATGSTTFLVEGRVSVMVPANWIVQRVLAGPGSARVQVTSPSDPELALHFTQSAVPPDETLSTTADRLQRAIGAEPAGVFIDFNPSGIGAGRPAVTYREVRAKHQVRWTVLLDGSVRISLGCQSRLDGADAIRDVCEQAVRSAHTI